MFFSLLIADLSSLADPDWWIRNFGPMGIALAGIWWVIRAFGPSINRKLNSQADLADKTAEQVPLIALAQNRLDERQDRMELKAEKALVQIDELHARIRPREAHG